MDYVMTQTYINKIEICQFTDCCRIVTNQKCFLTCFQRSNSITLLKQSSLFHQNKYTNHTPLNLLKYLFKKCKMEMELILFHLNSFHSVVPRCPMGVAVHWLDFKILLLKNAVSLYNRHSKTPSGI